MVFELEVNMNTVEHAVLNEVLNMIKHVVVNQACWQCIDWEKEKDDAVMNKLCTTPFDTQASLFENKSIFNEVSLLELALKVGISNIDPNDHSEIVGQYITEHMDDCITAKQYFQPI